MLENFVNNAEAQMKRALQHAKNIENGQGNKTMEILNASHCMGQYYAYMDMIEILSIDKFVELGEKTRETSQRVLEAIERIYE